MQCGYSSKMLVWTIGLLAATMGTAHAQTPQVGFIFPAGGQRGQTVNVTVNGQNLQGATTVLFSGTGVTGKIAPTADGKGLQNTNANALPIVVTIAPDAPLGVHEVRVFGPRGMSNVGRLMVGVYPEASEVEPNSKHTQAQRINLPVTVNGQANPAEDVDFFAFNAQAGQQVVFKVDSFPLTFALDSVLILRDRRGRELATGRSPHRFDASLTYTFKESGTYVVEIRDWTYTGGANFVYRLTVGSIPYVTSVFPAGGRKGTRVNVALNGVNLGALTRQEVSIPPDASPSKPLPISFTTPQGISNTVPLVGGDTPEIIEQEPNDTRATATRLADLPLTINGRMDKPGDKDCWQFPAQKGRRFIFEVMSRRIGSPLDSVLYLYGSDGKELTMNDDGVPGTKNSRVDFTFPADGNYTLMMRDLANRGGERFVYRIVIVPPPSPDFTLTATPDAVNVGQGSTAIVTVNCQRLNGFKGDVALNVPNPPPGITVSGGLIRADQNATLLSVTAASNAQISFAPLEMVGTATVNNQTVTKRVAPMEIFNRRAGQGQAQREVSARFLSIAEQPLFALKTNVNTITVMQGQQVQIPVTVTRKAGFKGNVNVTLSAQPALSNKLRAPQVTIPADKNEGIFNIDAASDAPSLTYLAFLNGNADKTTQPTPLFTLNVVDAPVSLAVSPNNPTLTQGGTAQVKVTLTRKNNFAGEVTLSLADPPKGVSASEVKVLGNQKEATFTLNAAADAAVGSKPNVVMKASFNLDGQVVTLKGPAITLTVNPKK